MAALQLSRLAKFGTAVTVTSIPLLTYKVYAEETEESTNCNCQDNMVKISRLPLYDTGSTEARYEYLEEDIGTVRQYVSKFRTRVWSISDYIEDKTGPIKDIIDTGVAHTLSLIDYIQNDPRILPRAAVITVAGLGGIVAGYRGGIVRKVFLSASAMTAAAALCYPNMAVKATVYVFGDAYDYVQNNVLGPIIGRPEPAKPADSSQQTVDQATEEPPAASDEPTEQKIEKRPPLKGDPGQSLEEDKDLYTTRGS